MKFLWGCVFREFAFEELRMLRLNLVKRRGSKVAVKEITKTPVAADVCFGKKCAFPVHSPKLLSREHCALRKIQVCIRFLLQTGPRGRFGRYVFCINIGTFCNFNPCQDIADLVVESNSWIPQKILQLCKSGD